MRRDCISGMREEVTILAGRIRVEIEGPEDASEEETLLRAWTAWNVAVGLGETFGAKSFGLLALDVAFDTMNRMEK